MKCFKRWLFCLLLILSPAVPAFAAAPERIISMSPAATEILFALSLGDRLIGVTRFCDYPPEVEKIPRVASLLDINLETLLTLSPDLVVLVDLNEALKERIERLGIATFTLRQETLEELCDSIEGLAAACGVADRGKALAGSMRADFRRVAALTASLPIPGCSSPWTATSRTPSSARSTSRGRSPSITS